MFFLRKDFWKSTRVVAFTWAIIVFGGFIATHFYQDPNINWVWVILSIIGFLVMVKFLPIKSPLLRKSYLCWIVMITIGMIVSFAVFYIPLLSWLVSYLGVFWLILLGIAFLWNGDVFPPMKKRLFLMGAVQILAGLIIIPFDNLLINQYLIAAVVGGLAMLYLMK